MSLYRWLRPLLFALPPEAAHALSLAALRAYGLGPPPRPSGQSAQVMGLVFPNRLGLAAGFDKNGVAVRGAARLGFGFVEAGTVTPKRQRGNPKPRLFRLMEDAALINRMGFNNAGAAALAANLRRARERLAIPVGVNIGKGFRTALAAANDDYCAALAGVFDVADYVVVNLSSPNTAGLRRLQAPEAASALIAALVRKRDELAHQRTAPRRRPLLVKLAPDLEPQELAATAAAVLAAGADGFVVVNTTVQRPAGLRSPHAAEAGGLSGQPLFAATLETLGQLRAEVGPAPPVIAVGGVCSAAQARALRQAGADLVQIYSALIYEGPAVVRALAEAVN